MKSEMIFFSIFISIFYLVGIGVLLIGLHDYFQGQHSLSWPEVSGHIDKCNLIEDNDCEGTIWSVKLLYSYSVDGRSYEGDQLAFGYCGSSAHEEHKAIYEKLKTSDKVLIKYDPNNPVRSVVAAGFNRSTFLKLTFAIMWLLFVIGFTVLAINSSGQDSQILRQINMIQN